MIKYFPKITNINKISPPTIKLITINCPNTRTQTHSLSRSSAHRTDEQTASERSKATAEHEGRSLRVPPQAPPLKDRPRWTCPQFQSSAAAAEGEVALIWARLSPLSPWPASTALYWPSLFLRYARCLQQVFRSYTSLFWWYISRKIYVPKASNPMIFKDSSVCSSLGTVTELSSIHYWELSFMHVFSVVIIIYSASVDWWGNRSYVHRLL